VNIRKISKFIFCVIYCVAFFQFHGSVHHISVNENNNFDASFMVPCIIYQ